MFKVLAAAFVLATLPFPAHAGFLIAGIGAIISTVGGWLAAGGVVGFLANTGLAFLASAVSALIAKAGMKQQDVFRELQDPNSLPTYRFAYGQGWVPGTPAPVRVKGRYIYACYILNSRPSEGPFTLYLDKREVVGNGANPYDFNGPGVNGTNGQFANGGRGPFLWYWIGRGGQTRPPQRFLDDVPDFYEPTDGWRGLTVLWAIFRAGNDEEFADRWPAAPPEVIVDGKWSRVWDPRDVTQNPDNPATWKWSRNQALCTLDALMRNPVRPYPVQHLWIESFNWAADVADVPFPVKVGDPIPRFSVDGVLVWSEGSEIEDQVNPLLAAGAGRWLRAYGQLGILPATYSAPVGEIVEVMSEAEMVFERWRPGDELYTEAYVNFTSPLRAYESATTPTYKVVGAEALDSTGPRPLKLDLSFIHDYRQGQYVSKIEVMRTRMQKSISFTGAPDTVNLLAGANLTMNLPAPYTSRNGVYKVEQTSPADDAMGSSGQVALSNPMIVRQESPSIYSWNPAVDEQDMVEEFFDGVLDGLSPPTSLIVSSGAEVALESGNSVFPRAMFRFTQVNIARITGYEWVLERRLTAGPLPTWVAEANGAIQEDEDVVTLEGYTGPLSNGVDYRIGVRSVASTRGISVFDPKALMGTKSSYTYSSTFRASVGASLAPAPTPLGATPVVSGITVRYRTPNVNGFSTMEIYASDTNNINTATFLFGPLSPGKNAVVSQTETGLTDGQTRYYWARSRDNRGFLSPFSPVMSATFSEA